MDPLMIALLIIAGGILLGPRVLFAVILIPTALFIGLLALLLVIGGTVLVARDERRTGTHWAAPHAGGGVRLQGVDAA